MNEKEKIKKVGKYLDIMSGIPPDVCTVDEAKFQELIKKRGEPSYHKSHKFKADISKNGTISFHCEDCDVTIFLGELKGFDNE